MDHTINTPPSLKLLTIGDPHFKTSNPRETEEMAQKICQHAKDNNYDSIIVLGDVLDRHESIHVMPFLRVTKFLSDLSDIAPLYVIVGNHDRPNNSDFLTQRHPFISFKKWPNTYIIDQGMEVNIKGYPFLMVPYVPPGRFDEAIHKIINPDVISDGTSNIVSDIVSDVNGEKNYDIDKHIMKYKTVFAHQEFRGAKMGAITSTVGDEWSVDRPFVISGHIHDYDKLQDNIIYTGTPIQHAFGDRDDKTISAFTWDNIDQKYPIETKIDLAVKKKVLMRLTWNEITSYNPPDNQEIKIILSGTAAEIKTARQSANYEKLRLMGIKISEKLIPNKGTTTFQYDENHGKISYINKLVDQIKCMGSNEYNEAWNEIFS